MNGTSLSPSDQRLGGMNTLVLRQVPDALYRRLKAVAAAHRRCSMHQEAILALEGGLPGEVPPRRPTKEESRRWLEQKVWSLPGRSIHGSLVGVRPLNGCIPGPAEANARSGRITPLKLVR
jgi:plasmid stability protein